MQTRCTEQEGRRAGLLPPAQLLLACGASVVAGSAVTGMMVSTYYQRQSDARTTMVQELKERLKTKETHIEAVESQLAETRVRMSALAAKYARSKQDNQRLSAYIRTQAEAMEEKQKEIAKLLVFQTKVNTFMQRDTLKRQNHIANASGVAVIAADAVKERAKLSVGT
jgi:hypothetical protein